MLIALTFVILEAIGLKTVSICTHFTLALKEMICGVISLR